MPTVGIPTRLVGALALLFTWSFASPAEGRGSAGNAPPYGEHDLLLGAPQVYGGPVYFPDEMQPLADAVAYVLARPTFGYHVIPLRDLRALWKNAQAGQLPGVKVACDAPPSPARLADHIYRAASTADVRVDCPRGSGAARDRPACVLDVTVFSRRPTRDEPDRFEETARFHAPLPFGEPIDRWAGRITTDGVARGPGLGPSGGLGLAGDADDPKRPFRVKVSDVTVSGDWRGATVSDATFSAQTPSLDACTRNLSPARDSWLQPYVVEVDGSGAVRRCEFLHVAHLPRPEFACVCSALRATAFGAGASQRRAMFNVAIRRAQPPANATAALVAARANDPSATLADGELDEDALIECLSGIRSDVNEPELPVRFVVGADGHVQRHHARWPATIPGRAQKCMDQVLARARFACPLTGAATIDARLQVIVSR